MELFKPAHRIGHYPGKGGEREGKRTRRIQQEKKKIPLALRLSARETKYVYLLRLTSKQQRNNKVNNSKKKKKKRRTREKLSGFNENETLFSLSRKMSISIRRLFPTTNRTDFPIFYCLLNPRFIPCIFVRYTFANTSTLHRTLRDI